MPRKGSLSTMLAHRVELWRKLPAAEANKLGQHQMQDQKIAELYAAVVPQTGSLLSGRTGETKLARTTHKVILRYREDIRTGDWIMFRGQHMDILYILDTDARRERLEVFCEVLV